MSDLHLLERSAAGLRKAEGAYKKKCTLILERVFDRHSVDTRQAMLGWLTERFQKTPDPTSLLHDDPLYVVGRYLGFSPLEIPPETMERATKMALDQGWDRIP
jgi:hypothetical protein